MAPEELMYLIITSDVSSDSVFSPFEDVRVASQPLAAPLC